MCPQWAHFFTSSKKQKDKNLKKPSCVRIRQRRLSLCFEVFGNVAAEKVKHIQITFAVFVRAEIVNQSAVIIGHRRGVLNFRIGFLVDSPRRFIKQARIINISVDI